MLYIAVVPFGLHQLLIVGQTWRWTIISSCLKARLYELYSWPLVKNRLMPHGSAQQSHVLSHILSKHISSCWFSIRWKNECHTIRLVELLDALPRFQLLLRIKSISFTWDWQTKRISSQRSLIYCITSNTLINLSHNSWSLKATSIARVRLQWHEWWLIMFAQVWRRLKLTYMLYNWSPRSTIGGRFLNMTWLHNYQVQQSKEEFTHMMYLVIFSLKDNIGVHLVKQKCKWSAVYRFEACFSADSREQMPCIWIKQFFFQPTRVVDTRHSTIFKKDKQWVHSEYSAKGWWTYLLISTLFGVFGISGWKCCFITEFVIHWFCQVRWDWPTRSAWCVSMMENKRLYLHKDRFRSGSMIIWTQLHFACLLHEL